MTVVVGGTRVVRPRRSEPLPHDVPQLPLVLAGAGAVALAVLLLAVLGTGAAAPLLLGDPGAVTRWGLPLARVVLDVASVATVGTLVVAVLLPRGECALRVAGAAALVRTAGVWAATWALAALVSAVLTLSDVLGTPVLAALQAGALRSAGEVPQVRWLLSAAWLAGLVALWSRSSAGRAGAGALLAAAGAALVPPLLQGHTGHGQEHLVATGALVVHALAASAWVGGLLALAATLGTRPQLLAAVLPRWSSLALMCWASLAATGVLLARASLDSPAQLVSSGYGRLLLAKGAALLLLGLLGHRQRVRGVPGVAAGHTSALLRLAAVELVLMAATLGLAAGLARSAPPDADHHGTAAATAAARPA
jgi:putative copper resistance protein D